MCPFQIYLLKMSSSGEGKDDIALYCQYMINVVDCMEFGLNRRSSATSIMCSTIPISHSHGEAKGVTHVSTS